MSDEPFSHAQLEAFTEEKCKGGACPICGNKEWWADIGLPSQRTEFFVIKEAGKGLPGMPHPVRVIWFTCANCGFIRQHLEQVIRDWVNDRA
jgi:hypothetical protein